MRRFFVAVLITGLLVPAPAWSLGPASISPETFTIYTDDYGVPHVEAASREAAAYGAGYLVGRDRLFFADVIRRLAQGRLSEILGAGSNDSNLRADMVMRREFFDATDIDRQFDLLPEEVRTLLSAFADGMNLSIAEQTVNPAERSALTAALGYQPDPWRPQDSVAVLLMFTMVSFAGEGEGGELSNGELLAELVAEHGDVETALGVWEDILLLNDPDAPAVIDHGEGPPPTSLSAARPSPEQIALVTGHADSLALAAAAEADMHEVVRKVMSELPIPRIGSYAIALDGTKTADGQTMLLGAPQAGMMAPSVFYEMGIHTPDTDCTGMTVPGLGPYIGIGWCNDHSWTLVAGNAGDQVDLFVETLCGPTSYVFEDDCLPMGERNETYVAKSTVDGQPPKVVDETILSTIHGPVFHLDEDAGLAYVFQRSQAGHFAQTFEGTHGLTFGRGLDNIEHVADRITATYNFTYADADGNIAYRFTGWQPLRHPDTDHRLPIPGTGGFEWQARSIGADAMPHVTNPASGVIAVNQGADSKPISWWPRPSGRFIGRWGHTASDKLRLHGEQDVDVARLKLINREIISDRDPVTPLLDHLIAEALEGDQDVELAEAFALYGSWRDAGFPRVDTDADGKLDDPALAIFGSDSLGYTRAPVWSAFVSKVWAPAGSAPRSGIVGQIGQTQAAIESPELFSLDLATGWQDRFREALSESLATLRASQGDDMSAWRIPAPTISFDAIGLIAPPRQPVVDHGTYSLIVRPAAGEGLSVLPPGNGRADRALDIARYELDGSFPRHFTDQLELYVNFEFKPMRYDVAQYRYASERTETLVYPGVRL